MAVPRPKRSRSRLGATAALTMVAWILVVVVGAGIQADDALLGVTNVDIVWFVVFVSIVVASLIMWFILKPWQGEHEAPGKAKGHNWVAVLVLVLGLLIWRPSVISDLLSQQQETTQEAVEDDEPVEEVIDEPRPEVVAETDLLLLVLVLVVLAGGWQLLRRRGETEPELADVDEQLREDVVGSIESLTLQLRQGDDPRTGVLNAYAVLESVLASHVDRRRDTETPTEYVDRSLSRLALDRSPFLQVVKLYEIARFSDDEITPGQRQQAIDALERARAEVADQL